MNKRTRARLEEALTACFVQAENDVSDTIASQSKVDAFVRAHLEEFTRTAQRFVLQRIG